MRRQTRRARMSSECGVASGPNQTFAPLTIPTVRPAEPDVAKGKKITRDLDQFCVD